MSKSNSVGTKLKVNNKFVGGLNSINGIEITAETLDVTDFDNSSGYRDKIPGFKEVGDLTGAGFMDGENEGQDECYALLDSGEVVPCEIIFPPKIGKTWSFNAAVTGFKTNIEIGDAIGFEVTFAASGKPTLAATAVSAG